MANLNPESAITWADANPDNPAADQILAGTARAFLRRGEEEKAQALLDRVQEPGLREMAETKQVWEKK